MRDPQINKDASNNITSGEETSLATQTAGGQIPGALPGLDYEIEAILQVPEIEESPFGQYVKDCPVCKSAVRCFFINFNEKVVMCENASCSWPFGYEELECLKHDDALAVDDEVESLKVMTYGAIPPSGSVISTTAWSEMDRSHRGVDSEEAGSITSHRSDADREAKLQEVLKQKEADIQTRKNLQDIKKLNVQLQKTYEDEDEISCIRNKKWIEHLNNLQSLSGVKLLRKEEMALLKENAPQGLTMNIDAANTSITINLAPPTITSTEEVTNTNEQSVTESAALQNSELTTSKQSSALIEHDRTGDIVAP